MQPGPVLGDLRLPEYGERQEKTVRARSSQIVDAEAGRLQAIRRLVHWLGVLALLASVTGFVAVYAWLDSRVASGWAALGALVGGAASGTVWLVAAAVLHLLARLVTRKASGPGRAAPVLSLGSTGRLDGIEISGRLDLAAPSRRPASPVRSSAATTTPLPRPRPGARYASAGEGKGG